MRELKCWSAQSEATLQDALDDVDWDMFQTCADTINEFVDAAVGFVSMLENEIVHTVKVTRFLNLKPWVRSIQTVVNARTAA